MILYNKRKQEKNLLFKSSEPQKKNIQKKKNYYYIIIDWEQAEKKVAQRKSEWNIEKTKKKHLKSL